MTSKKGFLQISFGWMFALIIGAFVLFLAIYFVVQFTGTQQQSQSGIASNDIGIILNPLETGFESGKKTTLELNTQTRINNNCSEEGNFGKQFLTVTQQSFGKWPDSGIKASFENKYVFSEDTIEGRNFILFVKPFELPYKIADLEYIIPKDKKYCFIDVDKLPEILGEIESLQLDNILNVTKQHQNDCPPNSEKVCFGSSSGCDISVNDQSGIVTKKEGSQTYTMVYTSPELMYAAIFSGPTLYECQLSRLILRQKQLASIYSQEALYVSREECNSNLELNRILSYPYNNPYQLRGLATLAEDIQKANDNGDCSLW